jgi:hypothetical protein
MRYSKPRQGRSTRPARATLAATSSIDRDYVKP